ncbi:Ribosomal protein L18 [Dillenia turbinata]|uniref:Ribosomal protein L18 n=1 Tax=Dillenia turbinata TaxID=194707 RepID=A0AAN8ZFF6_9MAGN
MTVLKRYVLRLFISIKYITANVVDRNNGRIVATASTVEHALKETFECGRTCNAKAATVVGEVLAMRLKVEGLEDGQGRGIHADVNKEIEKKGFQSRTKVWAVVNALRNNGVKIILDDDENSSRQRSLCQWARQAIYFPLLSSNVWALIAYYGNMICQGKIRVCKFVGHCQNSTFRIIAGIKDIVNETVQRCLLPLVDPPNSLLHFVIYSNSCLEKSPIFPPTVVVAQYK